MKNSPHAVNLKVEVEKLGYFVKFASDNSGEKEYRQMHIFKDSGFRKPIAQVSLTIACRINMMFDGVGKRDEKLLDLLVHFSKNL